MRIKFNSQGLAIRLGLAIDMYFPVTELTSCHIFA